MQGFVISDWQAIDRMTYPVHANYTYSVLTSVQAGLDMVSGFGDLESNQPRLWIICHLIETCLPLVLQIMVPYNYTEFIDTLTGLVKNKFIPMSRIDDAVRRILRVKFQLGLFETPFSDESFIDQLGHQVIDQHVLLTIKTSFQVYQDLPVWFLLQAHRDLAREAVRKSLVLLKNGENADEPMLPLPKKSSKILIAGSHADDLGNQCGGWTINWQGGSGNNLTSGNKPLLSLKT